MMLLQKQIANYSQGAVKRNFPPGYYYLKYLCIHEALSFQHFNGKYWQNSGRIHVWDKDIKEFIQWVVLHKIYCSIARSQKSASQSLMELSSQSDEVIDNYRRLCYVRKMCLMEREREREILAGLVTIYKKKIMNLPT